MKNAGCLFLKLVIGVLLVVMGLPARSQVTAQNGTVVEGAVYLANGALASGTVTVSWSTFTTATGLSVPAGSITAVIGADGSLSLNLTPNFGATPVGTYYTAVYHLSDGTVKTEYWTVPATGSMTLDGVKTQLQPSASTVESVTKSYVDAVVSSVSASASSYLPLTGGSLTGPLMLGGDPTSDMQASTMHYVNEQIATALPLAGGTVTGTLTVGNHISQLPRVDVRASNFAGGADPTGTRDSLAAIQAAIAFAETNVVSNGDATYPTIYFPPGHYRVSGTIRMPQTMHLVGDSKGNTILQETGANTNLLTVYSGTVCSTYACYGGIENLTLEGTGKATSGTLLEVDSGLFTMRDLHFFNTGGRGLQMNGPSERMVGYDLSFYEVRWPMVLAGDTNEDYFYNTHIIEAGQTKDPSGSPTWFNQWCYSINCTNGVFNAPGTSTAPTLLYPDPHGSIHIDKAVNVTFIGGSIKSTGVMSGVRIWNGDLVKFENMYHEDAYGDNIPRINRAYILGGKAEQTYFTGTLSGTGLTVAVNSAAWMPQYFGNPADVAVANGDWYPYVILPQDYNRASTAPSAYVPGLQQNQYEIVNIQGFASDGNLYVAARSQGGSTAPAGTQWPAGSVIEQYSGSGFAGEVELDNIHLQQVQGPTAAGGYQVACDQTNVWACGEILAGFAPDVQNLTSNPATNQVAFYTGTNDPNDPVRWATVGLSMRMMDMDTSASNPFVGQIATHHRASIQIYGPVNPEGIEAMEAVNANANGKQISLNTVTGGSYITAPVYPSTGVPAAVQVSLPDADTLWDAARGFFTKKASVFGMYQQFGAYMNGMQFQNLYCLFDTPTVDGGSINNRFCVNGGPSNISGSGGGYGAGIEYDSFNGVSWIPLFKVSGQKGAGTMTTSAAASFGSGLSVSGAASVTGALTAGSANITGGVTASGAVSTGALTSTSVTTGGTVSASKFTYSTSGASMSNMPVMVWSPWGNCSIALNDCSESGASLNLIYPVSIQGWTASLTSAPSGCTTPGALSLYNGNAVLATIALANGTSTYSGAIASSAVAGSSALQVRVSTAATGCATYGGGFNSNVTYSMQ